jgi:HEXXH motif-containing protein
MIGSHTLSSRDFALLSAGRGDSGTIETLLAGQFSRRMLLLQAVRESAQAAPGTLAALDTAYSLLADVQQEHPDVIRTVLTLPCVGLWAAACLRDGGRSHRYLSWLAATAALRARRSFEIEVPVWNGIVWLPTLGSARLGKPGAHTARIQSLSDDDAVVVAGADSVRIPLGDQAAVPGWRPVRQLRFREQGLELRMWLEDAGPFRGPTGLRLGSPLTPVQAARWEHVLRAAWRILVRRQPEHAEATAAGLRVLTPMRPLNGQESASVTAADAFGAVLLTPPSDPEVLALTLLHETQHGKLAALHHLMPLYTNDSRARWYARWRDDPRPPDALLHGAYAHLGVASFWHEARRSGDASRRSIAAEELAYWCHGVDEALGQLSSAGALTPAGTRFVAGMSRTLARLASARVPGTLRRRAAERGLCDRMVWRMRHLRPDSAVIDLQARAWLHGSEPAITPAATAVNLRPGERGPVGSARLLRAQRAARGGLGNDSRLPPADIAYARGCHEQAIAGYKKELERNPGDPGSWALLALALRDSEAQKAASFLEDYPELVRALALRIRALGGRPADPVVLTQWIAEAGTRTSMR